MIYLIVIARQASVNDHEKSCVRAGTVKKTSVADETIALAIIEDKTVVER